MLSRRGVTARRGGPVYSEGFEVDTGGWVPSSPATLTRVASPVYAGAWAMEIAPVAVGTRTATKTVTGLTVGRSYTLSVACARNATSGATVSVGVTGIGSSPAITAASGVYEVLTYTFVATATTHDIVATFVSTNVARRAYVDEVTIT